MSFVRQKEKKKERKKERNEERMKERDDDRVICNFYDVTTEKQNQTINIHNEGKEENIFKLEAN